MLVTLKEIMQIAEEKNIAIGSFNASGLEAIEAELAAAEELNLPVIIQFAQCHEPWIPLTTIGPIMVEMAKKSSVPVCVHLDHGETLEYLETALELGFTGIMYDGSVLPYEENLANTKKAVEMAAKYGASVEAELGSMGKRESGAGDSGAGTDDDNEMIKTMDKGLYARNMGGGSVNPATGEFQFAVDEGYLVEKGEIVKPVRGATLVGRGADVLMKIDRVGKAVSLGQGMCGSRSGSVPVNVGQPRIRISGITVGGRGEDTDE